MKDQFEGELFEDNRQFEEVLDSQNGDTWRHFKHASRRDNIVDVEIGSGPKPAFEETMVVDTIRAMRRDRKEYKKRQT